VDIKQEKECAEHLQAILLEASMYSDPHANTHKLVTFLISEGRQSRVAHQRYEMGGERRQKNGKYWNLHAVVMSDCSLIATQNSHAKHNQLVGRIPDGRKAKTNTQRLQTIMFRRQNRGSNFLKSYPLHTHTK